MPLIKNKYFHHDMDTFVKVPCHRQIFKVLYLSIYFQCEKLFVTFIDLETEHVQVCGIAGELYSQF